MCDRFWLAGHRTLADQSRFVADWRTPSGAREHHQRADRRACARGDLIRDTENATGAGDEPRTAHREKRTSGTDPFW